MKKTLAFEFLFSSSIVQKFLELVGDEARHHTDAEFAKSKGLPNAIVPGCCIDGVISKISQLVGPENQTTLLLERGSRFHMPVPVSSTVRFEAQQTHATEGGVFEYRCKGWLASELVVSGVFKVKAL